MFIAHTLPCAFNISSRRVGGIRFIKLGRFTISFCVSRTYRSIKGSN